MRLIKRFPKAGIMENKEYITSEFGTPQGSILSPILANIVMYYGIILFFERIKNSSNGYMEIINYADDMIFCFKYENEARYVYNALKYRLKKMGLEFAEDKTKLIEFGRFALRDSKRKGKNRPDTFDFLGFTHYCDTNRNGKFRVKRKTSRKKFKQKVQEFKVWIKGNRNLPLKDIMSTVRRKLIGHYNYYGITDNTYSLMRYYYSVIHLLLKWLNRRSQRRNYQTKEEFTAMIKSFDLPIPRIKVDIYAI